MTPQSNENTDILVWCDWLEDQGFPFVDEIRREVTENISEENNWHLEFRKRVFGRPHSSFQIGNNSFGDGVGVNRYENVVGGKQERSDHDDILTENWEILDCHGGVGACNYYPQYANGVGGSEKQS
jgi:hypothetical protein